MSFTDYYSHVILCQTMLTYKVPSDTKFVVNHFSSELFHDLQIVKDSSCTHISYIDPSHP